MPTYDYECRFCEHRFEHFQGLNDAKLRKCPECGRNGLNRLFGIGAGVVFKGSGFYETDYKRSSAAKTGDASGSEKGTGDGGPAKAKDSDAARKSAPKPKPEPDKSGS